MTPSTWVLLRGLARGRDHWGTFAEEFQRSHPDDRVLVLDIPGNGHLSAMTSPASVQAMVESLRGQLAATACQLPLMLVGLSMGGMIATAWARSAPQEVQGLILINSSMRPFSWPWERLRPSALGVLLKMLLSVGDARRWEQGVHFLTTRLAGTEVVDEWVVLRQRNAPALRNVLRQLWAAMLFRAGEGAPETPVLVLAARHDGLVSFRCSERIALAWKSTFRLHDHAGHDLPLDAPQWVIQSIHEWRASGVTKNSWK